jgi:hypothetical protein
MADGFTFGAVKLNKILYYADMLHYAHTGAPITGATYAKRQQGPVPKQVVSCDRALGSGESAYLSKRLFL